MRPALPDPIEYAADALSAAGALVERDAAGWMALLPEALARELGAGETCRLSERAGEGAGDDVLVCGMGTPALDRLLAWGEGSMAVAAAQLEGEPPRPAQARALAERFVVRNGPSTVADVQASRVTYLVSWIAWSAEGDDRYDGVVRTSVCLEDRGEADPGLLELADPLGAAGRLQALAGAPDAAALSGALALAARRAEAAAKAGLAEVRALVARRLRRDHERIAQYFEQLARDARAPRRRVEPAAIAARLAHLEAERDAKLRALAERYRLRVKLEPLALLQLRVPTACVRLRVRRRKLSGELVLRLAPGASAFDRLACAACSGTTAQPVLCDDRLHVLCEGCAPLAQGRPSCAACRVAG